MSLSRLLAKTLGIEVQNHLINRAYQEILSLSKPKKVILFGSASRGEMTETSDLDFVVIVATAEEAKQTQKVLNQISRLIDWPVDCLVIDENLFEVKSRRGGVYFVAQDEGRILYALLNPALDSLLK